MSGSHTFRATLRRLTGQDGRRHDVDPAARPPRAVCGERLREERHDRPDAPRCAECSARAAI